MSREKQRAKRRAAEILWLECIFLLLLLFWVENFTAPLMNRCGNQRQLLLEENKRNWQVQNSVCQGRHTVPVLAVTAIC